MKNKFKKLDVVPALPFQVYANREKNLPFIYQGKRISKILEMV